MIDKINIKSDHQVIIGKKWLQVHSFGLRADGRTLWGRSVHDRTGSSLYHWHTGHRCLENTGNLQPDSSAIHSWRINTLEAHSGVIEIRVIVLILRLLWLLVNTQMNSYNRTPACTYEQNLMAEHLKSWTNISIGAVHFFWFDFFNSDMLLYNNNISGRTTVIQYFNLTFAVALIAHFYLIGDQNIWVTL